MPDYDSLKREHRAILTSYNNVVESERASRSLVERLQALSRSQAAVLRTALINKLRERDSLIDHCLERLETAGDDQETVSRIRHSHDELIRASQWVGSGVPPDLMAGPVGQELTELRAANTKLEGRVAQLHRAGGGGENAAPPQGGGGGGGDGGEALRDVARLEAEKRTLVATLEDARRELRNAPAAGGGGAAAASPGDDAALQRSEAEAAGLRKEVAALQPLRAQVASLQAQAAAAGGDGDAAAAAAGAAAEVAAQASARIAALEGEAAAAKTEAAAAARETAREAARADAAEASLSAAAAGGDAELTALRERLATAEKEGAADREAAAAAADAAAAAAAALEGKVAAGAAAHAKLEADVAAAKAAAAEAAGASGAEAAELAASHQAAAAALEELKAASAEAAKKAKADKKTAKKEAAEAMAALQDASAKEKEELVQTLEAEVEAVMEEERKKMEEERKKTAAETKKLTKEIKKLKKSTAGSAEKIDALAAEAKALKTLSASLKGELQTALVDMPAAAKQTCEAVAAACGGVFDKYAEVEVLYRKELAERRRLFNLVQELRGNIRVFCRVRPPSKSEEAQGAMSATAVTFPAEGTIRVVNDRSKEKQWEFDKVFDFRSTQEQVYSEVSDLVVSVLDGYNVCIFAYGQTGSGKTFTMMGPGDNRGVNTRTLESLFVTSQNRAKEVKDTLSVAILEVYNEQIRDLLAQSVGDRKLEVRQGKQGMYVPDLTIVPVESIDDVFELINVADTNRSVTATDMNDQSSRSHMMMSVYVESVNQRTGAKSRGKLHLIDLAGSERINKSGATGVALKEAQNINKSLSALGDVIAARAANNSHVPYRNSTLTYLLQDSLSADSKTLMFVCCSPVLYNAEETFCSLNFAARVNAVELGKASAHTDDGKKGRKK